jgi:hypothetical protein
MSEWVALALVAALLYLVECLAWIESAAVACFRTPRGSWTCAGGAALPGNERGGVALADPLHVRGSLAVCHVWPLSLSPDGVTNLTPHGAVPPERPGVRYVSFEELKSARAEFGDIHVNGTLFARVASSVLARDLAAAIQRLGKASAERRDAEIAAIVEDTLDAKGAAEAWAAFGRRTRTLSAWCTALCGYTFIVAPAVLFLIGPFPWWMFLLAVWLALAIGISIGCFRVHAKLHPHAAYDRWVNALSMVLLPLAAIRCVDRLSRDALCRYSSAVVAPMLCGPGAAAAAVREQVIDLRNGPDPDAIGDAHVQAARCAEWFGALVAALTERALRRAKLSVSEPPLRDGEAMISYCPRCHAQFGRPAGEPCSVCPRVRLVPFAA